MNHKVFVINLERNVQRRNAITSRLEAMNIEWERIVAVLGSSLSLEITAKYYSSSVNKKQYRRQLSKNEIGCYMSHIFCWERIIEDNLDFALILEDDAVPAADLSALIRCLSNCTMQWDYIKLCSGDNIKRILQSRPLLDDYQLVSYYKIPSTTTAQLVSRQGARKLLGKRIPFGRPVDDDLQFWWEYDGILYGVAPVPVTQDPSFTSDIGGAETRKRHATRNPLRNWRLRLGYEYQVWRHRNKVSFSIE